MKPVADPADAEDGKPRGTCRECGRTGLRLYRVGEVGLRRPDGTLPGWVWAHKNKTTGTQCLGSWEAPAPNTD